LTGGLAQEYGNGRRVAGRLAAVLDRIVLSEISAAVGNHAQMDHHPALLKRRGIKALAVVGVGAFVTLGALSAAYGGLAVGPGPRLKAGSGSAPTNTTFQQPAVGGMNLGATATTTTPGSEPPITMAKPPLKAH